MIVVYNHLIERLLNLVLFDMKDKGVREMVGHIRILIPYCLPFVCHISVNIFQLPIITISWDYIDSDTSLFAEQQTILCHILGLIYQI